jgi:hypothetical protein
VTANFKPGRQDAWVDYVNDDRAPLLFISGSEGPPDAAERSALEREALLVESGHGRSTRA